LHSAGTLPGLLLLGFVLGMKHALEADHLAAVAALATRSRSVRHTILQGVVWGTGHTLTLLFFGGVVLAMQTSVPERLAFMLEGAVGLMLILLGGDVLRRLARDRIHFHMHRHVDGTVHVHAHSHAHDGAPHDRSHHDHVHSTIFPLRALFVGMMHGMAGTAALILVMVSGAGSLALGLLQLAFFGLGSILGMAMLSVAIAIPLRVSARSLNGVNYALQAIVGATTLSIGGIILHETLTRGMIS
jgi:ABC-type nickel/cobalt efflux system permease component RcnA